MYSIETKISHFKHPMTKQNSVIKLCWELKIHFSIFIIKYISLKATVKYIENVFFYIFIFVLTIHLNQLNGKGNSFILIVYFRIHSNCTYKTACYKIFAILAFTASKSAHYKSKIFKRIVFIIIQINNQTVL